MGVGIRRDGRPRRTPAGLACARRCCPTTARPKLARGVAAVCRVHLSALSASLEFGLSGTPAPFSVRSTGANATETSSSSGPTGPDQRLNRRGPSTLWTPATHPHHRRVDHHATRARPRDEAPPSAVVLRHQLQSIHPRGAAPRKRDKKSDRLMPGSLVLDSQTWCFGWPGHIAPGIK